MSTVEAEIPGCPTIDCPNRMDSMVMLIRRVMVTRQTTFAGLSTTPTGVTRQSEGKTTYFDRCAECPLNKQGGPIPPSNFR